MNNEAVLERLSPVFAAQTFGEARARLGDHLGLEGPAPANATARALADRRYAAMLASLGPIPEWREKFLADPYNAKFAPPEIESGGADAETLPSAATLAKSFAAGLLKWGGNGFETVDPFVLQRRRAACLGCDQLADPPKGGLKAGLYAVAERVSRRRIDADETDPVAGKICRACGCLVSRKARMATESCPLPSRQDPRFTRWGEPSEAPKASKA